MTQEQLPILVVGGAGAAAGMVTRALAARGSRVRALVKNDTQAAHAIKLGACETTIANLRDLASLDRAAQGVRAIFHIGPRYMPDEAAVGKAMIAAAERAGVSRFVYSSALHSIASRMVNHEAKRLVEERLIETDLNYTILQPARFMQNILLGWRSIVEESYVSEPFSVTSKIAFVDYADVAEAAAICLTQPGYEHATFELSGPAALDRNEIAQILSNLMGRPIEARASSVDDWERATGRSFEPYAHEGIRRMFGYYDHFGFTGGNSLILNTILGRQASTFQEFVMRFMAEQ